MCVSSKALFGTLLLGIVLIPVTLYAAPVEVKPFALLDVDGFFNARYLFSDLENASSSSSLSSARQSTWEEELNLSATAYVYHPGFLTIGVGGGPLLIQRDTSDESLLAAKNETLFNFSGKLDFLRLKPYPFSTYYRRSHPAISSSLSTRFVTKKDEYGLEGFFFPSLPFHVSYRLSHSENEGSDFGSVIDEATDLAEVKVKAVYRDGDKLDIFYDQTTRDSASGSATAPIRRAVVERSNLRLTARNEFGEERPLSLTQHIQRLVHESDSVGSKTETRSYLASGQYGLTESLRLTMSMEAADTLRIGADSKVRAAQAVMSHTLNDRINYGMVLRREDIQQTSFDRDTTSVDGNFSYTQPTSFGSFSFGANVSRERTDQASSADRVLVFDEPLTLVGTTAIELRNEFVLPSSVIVSSTAGTQVFTEGIDYRLVVIGSVTSVQRLVDGGIFDGQTVLVDYQYQTSGTAKYDAAIAGATVSANFLRYLNAYARYNKYDLTVIGGELTTPKNDREYLEVGLNADTQIGRWNVGGGITLAESDEEISPSTRESIRVRASTRIIGSLRFNASMGLTKVDLENSQEDSDRTDIQLGLSGRVWGRAHFRLDSVYTEDSGGTLPREDLTHVFNFQWHYRAVQFFFNARYADNTLGESERSRTEISASVRRRF